MTSMKALGALVILSAAIATPAFAHTAKHHRAHLTDFRGTYNQVVTSPAPRDDVNFGFGGRDLSRPGGMDPSLNPSGS